MSVQIDRVIPLRQAAKKVGVSFKVLQSLVESGKLEAVKLPNGEIAVRESSILKTSIISPDDYEHLRGRPITMPDAVKEYGISEATFRGWIAGGLIKVLHEGRRGPGGATILDLADVAYRAACYKEARKHGAVRGSRIFDKIGRPYLRDKRTTAKT
jgi:predicted site-specific integrase-resolvase